MTAIPLLLSLLAQTAVDYRVEYGLAHPDVLSVRLEVPPASPGPRVLVIPRAIPMGYGEQPFDRFVDSVRAYGPDGTSRKVRRDEGPRWILGDADTVTTRIEYQVDLARMEREILAASDTSKVRPTYLGILGYSVFGFVEGLEDRPARLQVEVPEAWPVVTTLSPRGPPATGSTSATAPNFYALADSQIAAGPGMVVREIGGRPPLFFVLYAEGESDLDLLSALARQAMDRVVDYFGSAPFEHYTVVQELLEPLSDRHSYGFSMEHLSSATFYLSRDAGLEAGASDAERARVLYNYAHHFAHAWIPKRSYGKGYFPFTWELAPVLDTIWLSEGFAQYAAIEALADGMPIEEGRRYRDQMLERRFRANLTSAPAFIRRMSLVELSRVASTRYSEDFRTGRNVFSRGGLMAAEIDDHIRRASGGARRLRDALRYLVAWTAEHGRAFEIEELPGIFEAATGVDTGEVMERWLEPEQ